MDEIVRQSLAKWPDVPDCTGWLALDARGRWRIGDPKDGPRQPITNAGMNGFINRNYGAHGACWIFQNGPQRVFVELEYTPFVWRLAPAGADVWSLLSHTGIVGVPAAAFVDDEGRFLFSGAEPSTVGVVHDHDTALVAELLEDAEGRPVDDAVLARFVESGRGDDGATPAIRLRWPRADADALVLPLERIETRHVPERFAFERSPVAAARRDGDARR